MPLSGMGDLGDLFEPGPENEPSQWRLPARAYAVSDIIGAAAGISLCAVVGIDNVISWPSNQVAATGFIALLHLHRSNAWPPVAAVSPTSRCPRSAGPTRRSVILGEIAFRGWLRTSSDEKYALRLFI